MKTIPKETYGHFQKSEHIGQATLYLGDCYNILPSLGWFDLLVTDPPYEMETSGGGAMRADRKYLDAIAAEELDQGFDYTIINALLCGGAVVFCHNNQIPKLSTFLSNSFERFALCQWHKKNPLPVANKSYQADTEFYIHAYNREFPVMGKLSQKRRHISTAVGKSPWDHPSVKPDVVMDKIITNVGGNSIVDPFMGTGSTGVAALKAGKRFVGIEKNPKHFQTAVNRIRAVYAELKAQAA